MSVSQCFINHGTHNPYTSIGFDIWTLGYGKWLLFTNIQSYIDGFGPHWNKEHSNTCIQNFMMEDIFYYLQAHI